MSKKNITTNKKMCLVVTTNGTRDAMNSHLSVAVELLGKPSDRKECSPLSCSTSCKIMTTTVLSVLIGHSHVNSAEKKAPLFLLQEVTTSIACRKPFLCHQWHWQNKYSTASGDERQWWIDAIMKNKKMPKMIYKIYCLVFYTITLKTIYFNPNFLFTLNKITLRIFEICLKEKRCQIVVL